MKTSSQDCLQAMAWLLSAAFSQAYSENEDQKAEWKGWENIQLIQKRSTFYIDKERRVGSLGDLCH